MIDTERAGEIAATLAADGYHLAVAEAGDRVRVTITAGPEACADCLVPENLMRGILGQTLRYGFQYYNGKSSQSEFFNQSEQQVGGGLWYDF